MSSLWLDRSALAQPFSSFARVTRFLEEGAAAVGIELHEWQGSGDGPLWVPRLEIPDATPDRLIVTCHDVNPLMPDGRGAFARWRRARRYRKAMRNAQAKAWRMTAPSQDAADRIGAELGATPQVVPWFAGTEFTPGDADLSAFPFDSGYVLYLGALRKHKNWEQALAAYASLPTELRTAHPLVFAGSRHRSGDECDGRIAELGLQGAVQFVSDLPDAALPQLMRGAAAFLFPSRLEGFGLPPLEAQAAGAPVIASNATSLPEVLGNGALLLDPDDGEGFASALRKVLEEPTFAEDLARRGQENSARFSARGTGEAMLAVLGSSA